MSTGLSAPSQRVVDGGRSWMTYETSAYRPEEHFAYWQEVICSVLSPSDNSSIVDGSTFAAKLDRILVGNVEISRLASSPIRSVRDSRLLRAKPNEDFFVGYMVSGSGTLLQENRTAEPGSGDIVVYDSARPFTWQLRGDYDIILGRIPRRMLAARFPDVERLTARVLPAEQPFASLIGNTMHEMLRLRDRPDATGSQRLATSMVDILATSLEFGLIPKQSLGVGHDELLARAKRFLLDNLEDPELNFNRLTAALGVSARTLCRLFAADGTTAMRWLWQQRLEMAHRMLREAKVSNVSQAVMLCGFNDFSHFGRAFKQRYGVLPKSLLKPRQPALS